MLWGNIIGVSFCLLQSQFHIFKLDPATYYVNRVPIEFNIWIYLLLSNRKIDFYLSLLSPLFLNNDAQAF